MVPLLELLAPVVEVFGLVYFALLLASLLLDAVLPLELELLNLGFASILLTASILFAIFVTLVALLAEEVSFRRYRGLPDLMRAVLAAVEENLGYRQLNAFWRLGGIVEALRSSAHDWGDMQREGFDTDD